MSQQQQQQQQQAWTTQFQKCGLDEGYVEFANFKKLFNVATPKGLPARRLNEMVQKTIGFGEVRFINGKDMLCGWSRHGQPPMAVAAEDDDDMISLRHVQEYKFDKRPLASLSSDSARFSALEEKVNQSCERIRALEADNASLRLKLREAQTDYKRAFAEINSEFAAIDRNFSDIANVINA